MFGGGGRTGGEQLFLTELSSKLHSVIGSDFEIVSLNVRIKLTEGNKELRTTLCRPVHILSCHVNFLGNADGQHSQQPANKAGHRGMAYF